MSASPLITTISCFLAPNGVTSDAQASYAYPDTSTYNGANVACAAASIDENGVTKRVYVGLQSLSAAQELLAAYPSAYDVTVCATDNCNDPSLDACSASGYVVGLSSPVCGGAPSSLTLPTPGAVDIPCYNNLNGDNYLNSVTTTGNRYCISATHVCSSYDSPAVPTCAGKADGDKVRLYFDRESVANELDSAALASFSALFENSYRGYKYSTAYYPRSDGFDEFTVCATAHCNAPSSDSCPLASPATPTVCAAQASATNALLSLSAVEPTATISCFLSPNGVTSDAQASYAYPDTTTLNGINRVCAAGTTVVFGVTRRYYAGFTSLAAAKYQLQFLSGDVTDLVLCTSSNCNDPSQDTCGTASGAVVGLSSPVCGVAPLYFPQYGLSDITCFSNLDGSATSAQAVATVGNRYCISATHVCRATDSPAVPSCAGKADGAAVRMYFDRNSVANVLSSSAVESFNTYFENAYGGYLYGEDYMLRDYGFDSFTVCATANCNSPTLDSCPLAPPTPPTVCAAQASATNALLSLSAAEPTATITCFFSPGITSDAQTSFAYPSGSTLNGINRVCAAGTVVVSGVTRRYYAGFTSLAAARYELSSAGAVKDLVLCTSAGCNNPTQDTCGTANGAVLSVSSPVCGGAPSSLATPLYGLSDITCYSNLDGSATSVQAVATVGNRYCISATHVCRATDSPAVPSCAGKADGAAVRMYFDRNSVANVLSSSAVESFIAYFENAYGGMLYGADYMLRDYGFDAFTLCNTANCNSPASDTCALAEAPVEASFTLSSLPSSALTASGGLTQAAITVLANALAAAVGGSCATCSATISRVVDASGKVLYPSARRLQTSALTVTFSVTGGSPAALQAVAAGAGASGSGFLATLAAQIVAAGGGYASVTAAPGAAPSPAAPSAATPIGAIVGGGVGGAGVLGGLAAAVYFLCIRKAAGAATAGAAAAAGAAAVGVPPKATVLVLRGSADPVHVASV